MLCCFVRLTNIVIVLCMITIIIIIIYNYVAYYGAPFGDMFTNERTNIHTYMQIIITICSHTSGNMWMASCRYVRTLYEPSKFKAIMRRIQPGGRGHTTPACVGRRKCIISSERETSAKIVLRVIVVLGRRTVFSTPFFVFCCLLGCSGLMCSPFLLSVRGCRTTT